MTVEQEYNAAKEYLERRISNYKANGLTAAVAICTTQLAILEWLWCSFNIHKGTPRGIAYGLQIHNIYKGICK